MSVPAFAAASVRESPEVAAQESTASSLAKPRLRQEIQITGEATWVDTGLDVVPGERLRFTASGTLRYPDAKVDNTAGGLPRSFKDLIHVLPFDDAGRGALIGRVGDKEVARPFLIGVKRDAVSSAGGRLFIGINQMSGASADGTYTALIEIYPPAADFKFRAVRTVEVMPGVDGVLFGKIPRRVKDKAGNAGDMVNFLILGSKEEMEKAFKSAGWVKVDPGISESVLSGVLASISKESYLTMPMSPLYLFGRTQDYGWAHAEPIQVVASRNHLRIWKAPFTVDGLTVWVGAATHDVGFEHDQRNDSITSITHKIDPNIDLERDFVERSLSSTGMVAEVTHFLPENPMLTAKTATGGSFHSNGEVLVLKLAAPD